MSKRDYRLIKGDATLYYRGYDFNRLKAITYPATHGVGVLHNHIDQQPLAPAKIRDTH